MFKIFLVKFVVRFAIGIPVFMVLLFKCKRVHILIKTNC